MAKFLQKKNIFLIEYKYIYGVLDKKNIEYKNVFFQHFTNHSHHLQAFCQKMLFLQNFAKLTEKHLCRSLFFNKVTDWKPETVRSSH